MKLETTNERGLIFLHIPKTAGTTLRTIIDRQYPRHVICYFHLYPKDRSEFFAMSDQRRRELRVLQGHIEFGFHRYISVPVDYITLLRPQGLWKSQEGLQFGTLCSTSSSQGPYQKDRVEVSARLTSHSARSAKTIERPMKVTLLFKCAWPFCFRRLDLNNPPTSIL